MQKVSVIVPSYKPGEYLWECLDSLKQQTLNSADFEVIIVLNGCCEPWESQISDYIKANNLTNFRLLQTNEGGVSNARNIGIENAKGEYITFIDDDDYISDCYLEELLDKATPDSAVLTDSRAFYDGEKGFLENFPPQMAFAKCSKESAQSLLHARAIFNGPWMKALPSAFIQGCHFDENLSFGEDGLFMFQISKHIKRLVYTSPKAIYYRRYRRNSLTTGKKGTSFKIQNASIRISKYLIYWLKNPFSYNFLFFLNRLLATIKGIILVK